ncbi:MAG: DUF1573 domain-containing protein [Planctomycetes bacterium]|nr:DUF1573 domain-containing protein [Planctomycetota bacterium]
MIRYSLLAVALFAFTTPVHAQSKAAQSLFDELTRDFGSVPRGQIVSHPFRIVNNTKETVHISGVRASCGRCSHAQSLQTWLKPGEETAVIAKMFTSEFLGTKDIKVYVTFDQPWRTEVTLWIQANSRDDIVFSPDNIAFGKVKQGATPESKITVSFNGSPTQVMEVKSESNYVQPTLKAVKGPRGETAYEISAKLRADTPAGKWYTDIWLKTNNSSMQKLRVPVTVEVEAPLTVNPSTVSLGQVKAGTETDRKVMIRGKTPFRITGIFGADKQLQVRSTTNESLTVHVLTVTINPSQTGDLKKTIRVLTDLQTNGEIEFHALAEVVP